MTALTALWLLLHDLDEEVSRDLAEMLWLQGELHPVYAERVMTITSFTLGDYLRAEHAGVTVFTLKSLPEAPAVAERLAGWLRGVPVADLRGIGRIYVIERTQDQYWGQYLRILANIVLIWRGKGWFQRLLAESTLYHEFGHHQDPNLDAPEPEREAFADRYAFQRFSAAHPRLMHPAVRDATGPLFFGGRWRTIAAGEAEPP